MNVKIKTYKELLGVELNGIELNGNERVKRNGADPCWVNVFECFWFLLQLSREERRERAMFLEKNKNRRGVLRVAIGG